MKEKMKYGWIKCVECGKRAYLWVESEAYKEKRCPKCMSKMFLFGGKG